MLDPVRFLSNLSTGEMGYAIAREAKKRGCKVTLISGPTALKAPKNISLVSVVSARDMEKACRRYFPKTDVLVMSAAVCDFTADRFVPRKIKRTKTKKILLKKNPDIVAGLSRIKRHQQVVGFCLETEDWLRRAYKKLQTKRLDGIVANYLDDKHYPFGNKSVNMAFIDKAGKVVHLKRHSKAQIAGKLLDWIETIF